MEFQNGIRKEHFLGHFDVVDVIFLPLSKLLDVDNLDIPNLDLF